MIIPLTIGLVTAFAAKVAVGVGLLILSYAVVRYLPLKRLAEWFYSRWMMYKNRDILGVTVKRKVDAGEFVGATHYVGAIVAAATAEILDYVDVVPETVDPRIEEMLADDDVVFSHPDGDSHGY